MQVVGGGGGGGGGGGKWQKPLTYFMVISCDRGGGGEQQRVSAVEVEEGTVSSCTCIASHRLWLWVMEVKGSEKGVAEAADVGVKPQVWWKMEENSIVRVLILRCHEV